MYIYISIIKPHTISYYSILDLSSDFDTINYNIFPLYLMKFVNMVNSAVGLCILFHLEYLL